MFPFRALTYSAASRTVSRSTRRLSRILPAHIAEAVSFIAPDVKIFNPAPLTFASRVHTIFAFHMSP